MSVERKKLLPIADFIALWNASESADSVARVTGRDIESVRRRASNLRGNGYHLKSMRKDFDVVALSKLAQKSASMDQGYFVLIWQNARSLAEVKRFTGIDSTNCIVVRVRQLRLAGVPLKRFNRRRTKPARILVGQLSSVSLCPNDYLGVVTQPRLPA
jgi:hypothetical protein